MKEFFAKISKRNWTIIGAALVVVLVLILVGRGGSSAKSTTTYQTTPAQRGDLTATVGATGSVRAIQSATLNWQTTGTVEEVSVKVGDKVSKGDILATLARTSLPQDVITAESNLVAAQKALQDLKSSDTDRAQAAVDLKTTRVAYQKAYNYRVSLNGKTWIKSVDYVYIVGQQVATVHWYEGYVDSQTILKADNDLALKKAQLDDAQRTYDRLKDGPNRDDVAAAQAKVDAAQATLNMARILVPFNGTVTQAEPVPGDQASVGKLAFRVDDLSGLLVDVQVSEVDINSIAADQPATLTFDAVSGKTYNGRVVEVSQAGDSTSGAVNFTVTVQLTDADEQVKPGMTAAVTIIVNQVKDQLLVPNRAVRIQDGKHVVYVLKNGQAQLVEVTLGPSSDTQSVVLDGGLKVGDLVVLNPPTQSQLPSGGPPVTGGGG